MNNITLISMRMVKNNGRKLITQELVNSNGIYTIDFDDFEKKINVYIFNNGSSLRTAAR